MMTLKSLMSWSPWLGATVMARKERATTMMTRRATPHQKLWPWLWPQRRLSRRRRRLPRFPVSPGRPSRAAGQPAAHRRAEPGQEGQSFSCLLDQNDIHIYTAMLRRSLAAGQHLYGDEQPDILTSSENHLVFRSDSILALS